MATNLFKEAAKYRRAHPSVSQAEAVKIVARKNKKKPARKKAAHKKKAAVGKVRRKKAAPKKKAAASGSTRRRKTKIKVKKGGTTIFSIGAISMSHIRDQHAQQAHYLRCIDANKAKMARGGLTKAERKHLQAENRKYREHIKSSKKHVTTLKRSI